jgi:hypothetical protein
MNNGNNALEISIKNLNHQNLCHRHGHHHDELQFLLAGCFHEKVSLKVFKYTGIEGWKNN